MEKNKRHSETSIIRYWFLALCGVLLGVILNSLDLPLEGAALAVLGFAPLFYILDRRIFKGFLIGPLIFAYLFHAFGYSLGPLWQIYIIRRLDPIAMGFIPAQWGCVLGLATLAISFPWFFRLGQKWFGPRNPVSERIAPQRSWAGYSITLLVTAIIIIVLGFLSGVANRLAGDVNSLLLSSLVSAFSNVIYVAFFFLGYEAVRHRGGWWVLWLVSYILFAAFYFLDGGRGAPIYALIFSVAGWVWACFPWRRLFVAGLFVLAIFIPFVGVVGLYRSEFADLPSRISLAQRIEGLKKASNQFTSQNSLSLEQSTEAFARALTAFTVDRVFLLTPKYLPFVGFEGINKIFYAFVPEIIRPGRPILLDGNDLAIQYGAAPPASTGSYIPTVGDGYRRGGWIGIVLLYLFTSLTYAFPSAACWERRGEREWMAMFIFLIFQSPGMWSTTMLSNFYFLFWLAPRNFIVFWLLRLVQDFTHLSMPIQTGKPSPSKMEAPTTKKFLDETR
jgi:hypothetical protein